MDPISLLIVITPELDKALSEVAKEQMVTKEDIARCILAGEMAKVKNLKTGPLGFDKATLVNFVTRVAAAFVEAIAAGKKKDAEKPKD